MDRGGNPGVEGTHHRRSSRRHPRGDGIRVALLGGGRSVRFSVTADDRYGLGEDRSFETVIMTELVWNAETPADGLCEMTVPAGCVEIAKTTFT